MGGPVTAEADAVHTLAQAVSRYAEHVQNVAAAARAAAQREAARMEQVAEQRSQALKRASQRLAQAQLTLKACMSARKPDRGPSCGPQQCEVDAAQRERERAEASYRHAVTAVAIAAAAARDLSSAVSSVESVIVGQSSVAVTALLDLEDRLNRIGDFVRANWVKGAIIGLSLLDVGHIGIKLSEPFISPQYQATVAQQEREHAAEQVELGLEDQARLTEKWDDTKNRLIRGDQ